MQPVKTAAVVHDLSGVGRCALTVVLPVLSAMGVQACPVPTAVLSTHTGGFDGIASVDLTDLMGPYLAHWRRLNMRFDAVYSGYLANCAQAEHVLSLMRWQKCLSVVDPVMGDEGEMYSALPREIPAEMRRLCAAADVITPNLTEAALLLDEPFCAAPRTGGEVEALLKRLLGLGARSVVLTSVPMEDGSMANAWMPAHSLSGHGRFVRQRIDRRAAARARLGSRCAPRGGLYLPCDGNHKRRGQRAAHGRAIRKKSMGIGGRGIGNSAHGTLTNLAAKQKMQEQILFPAFLICGGKAKQAR